ncbi:MAG TPA: diiron oxygenase [Streptosporangiaceae bacterium]|nr:diiron oxygenase [Streptosporangiaceae bacterium]
MTSDPLGQWYEKAGVRSGVRRIFHDDAAEGKVFFPDRLVPHLDHPAVAALPMPDRDLLPLLHLYQFLLATTHVETRVVNVGAERIATGRAGVELPVAMRMDAFKVYCDEGYHALYSLDLAEQIARATGVPVPGWDYGGFVARLADAGGALLGGEPVLAQLLQVVVFETLITAILNEAPSDPDLAGTVREVLRDHARDEGRHHRFFTAFFHELWAGLSAGLRIRVARTFPALVQVCMTADTAPVRSALRLAGLDDATAGQVVRECYDAAANPQRTAEITRATVAMCRSAGVLDVPGAADAFAVHGLILREPS